MSDRFPPTMTLAAAREVLRPLTREPDGVHCPVCLQTAKTYTRSMTSVAARALRALHEAHGREYGHLPTVVAAQLPEIAGQGGYLVLGQHWDLIEPLHTPTGVKAGFWRVTALGEAWLEGRATVPKQVSLYDGKREGEPYGDAVSCEDVLGTHFDRFAIQAEAPDADGDDGRLFDMDEAA